MEGIKKFYKLLAAVQEAFHQKLGNMRQCRFKYLRRFSEFLCDDLAFIADICKILSKRLYSAFHNT